MTSDVTLGVGLGPATVLQAAAGDAAALARIVAAYHDDMARLCFVICGDQDIAQEAVQDAWAIAWRKLHTLRDPDRIRPWLMTIAANEVRRSLRERRRRRLVEIPVPEVGAGRDDIGARDIALDLGRVLDRLDHDDRALLAMRHLGGFGSAEIGSAMGISADAVRARLSRLVARLRKELGDD